MIPLDELLVSLADGVVTDVGGRDAGLLVSVTGMALDVPVEARILPDGRLEASLPRNRIATGFDSPAGRLSLRLGREP